MSDQDNKTKKSEYLNKDKIDALDTEDFDAVKYQKDGQGGPRAGLEKEYKKD